MINLKPSVIIKDERFIQLRFYDNSCIEAERSERKCPIHETRMVHYELMSQCLNGFYHYYHCIQCGITTNLIADDEVGNGSSLLW